MNRISDLPQELVEPAYEVADVITLEALLEAGLAVAAAFKLGTYRGRDRKLVFRPLVEPALRRTICLITHSERALSPAAAALIKSAIHHLHRRTDAFRLALILQLVTSFARRMKRRPRSACCGTRRASSQHPHDVVDHHGRRHVAVRKAAALRGVDDRRAGCGALNETPVADLESRRRLRRPGSRCRWQRRWYWLPCHKVRSKIC